MSRFSNSIIVAVSSRTNSTSKRPMRAGHDVDFRNQTAFILLRSHLTISNRKLQIRLSGKNKDIAAVIGHLTEPATGQLIDLIDRWSTLCAIDESMSAFSTE